MSRLGIFGGTFDPPHLAHRWLCEAARDALALDAVGVLPAGIPPHGKSPEAGPWHRWAMTVLAFRDAPGLIPSPRELERQGVSYTVETLMELAGEHPDDELFLIIGGDSYDDLPNWFRAGEIVRLAHLAVVDRPGALGTDSLRPDDRARLTVPGEAPAGGGLGVYPVPMDPAPTSATELRQAIAADRQPDGLDPLVYDYIAAHGLYGARRGPTGGI